MDAFYASIEQREDPSLRGRPVIVGGPSERGVVAAASYEARPFGVRSAMPTVQALRLCPEAVVVPGNHSLYGEVSRQIFDIFRRYTPLVQGLSLDEAFLDVTASRTLFGSAESIARRIKAEIRQEVRLTASAGVAPCKFVAKIASDLDKPDGLVVVAPDAVVEMLAPLPIERMWGVGPKTSKRLRAAGFRTIGDLAGAAESQLESMLGSWGAHVRQLARGIDDRDVEPGEAAKSIGAEETFTRDLSHRPELERHLLAQSGRVARRLLRADLCGRVVTVKLKYADFTLRSRQSQLPDPVADTDSIYAAARELLHRFPDSRHGVRLTGVAVSGLEPGPPTGGLFPDPDARRRLELEQLVAKVSNRFGSGHITRATLIEEGDDERLHTVRVSEVRDPES